MSAGSGAAAPDDLAEAVQAMVDGRLDDDGYDQLAGRLRADPVAAAVVAELLATDALLLAAHLPDQRQAVLASVPRPELPRLASRVLRVVRQRRVHRQRTAPVWTMLIAAAGLLAVIGLTWRPGVRRHTANAAAAAAVVVTADPGAALVGPGGQRPATVGARVETGERLTGGLGLRLAGGSTCDLAAGAAATLRRIDGVPGLDLDAGTVAIAVTTAEHGLWVATPHGRLTDLGTRFRVTVQPTETWLTVASGQVEAAAASSSQRLVGSAGEEIVLRHGEPPLRLPAADADIVLTAADAAVYGLWQRRKQVDAAGGLVVEFPLTARVRKNDPPLAEPADRVEFRLAARGGVDYRLWLRLHAAPGLRNSVWVQADGAIDATGAAQHRSGSAQAFAINAREWPVARGWSWIADHHFNADAVPRPPLRVNAPLRFATSGRQVLRLHAREPGAVIDQVVLSPLRWRDRPPGAESDDATILRP